MKVTGLREIIRNDESLALFMRKMRDFDQLFCDFMAKETEFNLQFEVRGNMKEILHVRVSTNDREQPKGAQKRIDARIDKEAVPGSYA